MNEIEAGQLFVNVWSPPTRAGRTAHEDSGFGREPSNRGILEFVNANTMVE